ncbi:hypothetical protein [Actinokineospora pegani]|nr:hypothetical protein [Actinokineospora pegani]
MNCASTSANWSRSAGVTGIRRFTRLALTMSTSSAHSPAALSDR